ncbi:RICIN domain-containing protein [Streptomyces sp. NPDC006654]|uniref:RICIN domain-containing protein n=1 Tax=unclassified Streptomyces TaxID=2593676 RepID=UPI0033E2E1AE
MLRRVCVSGALATGAPAQAASVTVTNATQFTDTTGAVVHAHGGYVQIVGEHSGKCLDVSKASTANGARLIQWPCGTGTNQQFLKRTA